MWLKFLIGLNIILLHFAISQDVGESCTTNEPTLEGNCAKVSNCEAALIEIRKKKFHQFVRCGFVGNEEVVCCPHATNKFGGDETRMKSDSIAVRECQKIKDSTIPPLDLHILGGETASLGEFPHMRQQKYIICENFNCLAITVHEIQPGDRQNRQTDSGVLVIGYRFDSLDTEP